MPDPTTNPPTQPPAAPAPPAAPLARRLPSRGAAAAPLAVGPASPAAGKKVLERMLDRLFASLVNGPAMNCRPHRSRQRVDWFSLSALDDLAPAEALRELLGDERGTTLRARAASGKKKGAKKTKVVEEDRSDGALTDQPEEGSVPVGEGDVGEFAKPQAARAAPGGERGADVTCSADGASGADDEPDGPDAQVALLQKLNIIADDARTYEQDTGVHALFVGFPLLSLPPAFAAGGAAGRQSTRRVLAPVAFVPVSLALRRGATRGVEISCRGEGIDLVQPNAALLAWLQRQKGRAPEVEVFADERGEDPWREVSELVRRVCEMVDLPVPDAFADRSDDAPAVATGAKRQAADPREPTVDASTPGAVPPGPDETEEPPSGATELDPTITSDVSEKDASIDESSTPAKSSYGPATLELQPAPRTEDLDQEAAILPAAVIGLFPAANQGLLRDMQEMAEDPTVLTGPLEAFIRLGPVLDAGAAAVAKAEQTAAVEPTPAQSTAAQPAQPAAPAPSRTFASERLVADADPCQARAVRMARASKTLVVHGPPGTGKSQTIANIIGDHLARDQRVLFVCEKRTALDVVADRLAHMGLGGLCGVVHDPQRDQRELYKKIREQLDQLTEAKDNPRAKTKLEENDAELQALHAELSAYHAALARRDAGTGLSFHDLMGEWLAASPGAVLGGDAADANWRVSIDQPAATALAGLRLAELSALEHPLGETFARARKVDYARNPWTACLGTTVSALLARPVEQVRAAVRACVAAAGVADQTSREALPAHPPFAAQMDLNNQAAARVRLADRVTATLTVVPPDVLDRWAGADVAAIRAARAKVVEAQPHVLAFEQQPLDSELAAAWLASVGHHNLPDAGDLAQQKHAVQRYAEAFGMSMQWVEQVRQRAPRAPWSVIARWMAADTATALGVLKKLDAAAPLAQRAAAEPLDPELAAQYRRQPFDIAHVLRLQSAIETYLPVANALLGFLHGAKKKAAAPAMEFFGLGVTGPNAERVHKFLAGLRARLEVREALMEAVGPEGFQNGVHAGPVIKLPDDAELLRAFDAHRSVLAAAADFERESVPNVADAADPTTLVNGIADDEHHAAAPTFALFHLPPNPENAKRVLAALSALQVRVVLQGLNENVLNAPTPDGLMDDDDLAASIRGHAALFGLAVETAAEPATADVWPHLAAALVERAKLEPFLAALRRSPERAAGVLASERALAEADLFNLQWFGAVDVRLRLGEPLTPTMTALADRLDTLEDVARVAEAAAKLPATVRPAAGQLLAQSAEPGEAWDVLRRDVVAGEIRRRLAADPNLQSVDGHRLATSFDRYRELSRKRRDLVRDVVVDLWTHKRKERLLNEAGTKLSQAGASLGRRLLLSGKNAMRLRKVVSQGRQIEGGDPLFDVCPVWMVSPQTAAQVFPREPIFDVVVFDEASQCRLEEALPVLCRGQRVVIAGDPRQLPPTRFFESAAIGSDDADEPADEQGWFEQQQGEVEDLLTAALGLDADQSYLDVHYRSKHAALIGFSNAHFYGSRLQPIPGHPAAKPALPPIRIVRADGVYEKRANEKEADAVVALVAELLGQRKPPSVGIACFNMVQRDLIVEKLDDLAAEDARFAKRLAEARERVGAGAFEGLFVKNLENVQGDERDHMIISTTYGPDAKGKFYRRFGPLAMPGGGRRLNVLVTRARQQVHVVTSIPAEQYRSLPQPTDGQTPGGGWLLFSYLKYADELAKEFELVGELVDATTPTAEPAAAKWAITVGPTRARSAFVEALAGKLAGGHGAAADVYWGNDGFCVDLAVRPGAPGTVAGDAEPVGVLCDAARFAPADDLMEWDVFRTGVLEGQGWKLHRVWTPHFFRDPPGRTAALLKDVREGA